MTSHETPADPVEIRQDAAITIQDALVVATEQGFPIGKSTIQRWARHWAQLGTVSPVKSLLVTTRTGNTYRLDRDDFITWVLEQKQNAKPLEAPQYLERPRQVSQDPIRSQETARDLKRPTETSRDFGGSHDHQHEQRDAEAKLREEVMNLKIDLEVRKQLLNQAVIQSDQQRAQTEILLRELGGLQFQVRQLAEGQPPAPQISPPPTVHQTGQGTTETSQPDHSEQFPHNEQPF